MRHLDLLQKGKGSHYGFLSKKGTGQIRHFRRITEALVYRTDLKNWASER